MVAWLVRQHKVCVLPGSSCGESGYIRIAYANLHLEACQSAAARLKVGLRMLVDHGAAALTMTA